VVRLFSARTLFVLSGLFIVYATSIPWDFAHAPSLRTVQWIPLWDPERGRPPSISDLVQNVVLFLPFGFFGALALDPVKARGLLRGPMLMAAIGLSLSTFVETLQTMSVSRTPSTSDITTNTFGTLLGAVAAFIYRERFEERFDRVLGETMRRQPGLIVFASFLLAIAFGALSPFIPSLDVSDLRANVRQLLDHPWGPKPLPELITDLLLFTAFATVTACELPFAIARQRRPPFSSGRVTGLQAAAFATLFVAAFALLLEIAQLFIIDHVAGLEDVAVAAVAAVVGSVLALVVFRMEVRPAMNLGAMTMRAPTLVFGFAVLAPAVRALEPFRLAPIEDKISAIGLGNFVPFWPLFRNVNLSTFRNVFEAAMFYVPLGYALTARHRSPAACFAIAFVLADVLEVLQIPIEGRTFDITEGIYAGTAALAGAFALQRLRVRAAASAPIEPGRK
jgi:glycopeptide antibiotics resistance protein